MKIEKVNKIIELAKSRYSFAENKAPKFEDILLKDIKSINYNSITQKLKIKMKNGDIFTYEDITQTKYDKVLKMFPDIIKPVWKFVTSTNIAALRYDPYTKELNVKFKNKSEYQYKNIPQYLYEQVLNAASVGSTFYWNIREFEGKYPYTKLS